MKNFLILFFIVIPGAVYPSKVCSRDSVLVLQSVRIAPYEEALEGFKSVTSATIHRVVISEQIKPDLSDSINSISPDIILAIGKEALVAAKTIKNIPVVYAMVLNPESILSDEDNIFGVSMKIPLEKHLLVFKKNMPGLKNLGVVYDPEKSGQFMKDAAEISRITGIRLITKKVSAPKDVPSAILGMKGSIDAYWMLPDITVVTPESVEFMLLFSIENNIPVFTFSEKYVEMGAFLSINISALDIGKQAGELTKQILNRKNIEMPSYVYAKEAHISTNLVVAQKLGISESIAFHSNEKILMNIQLIE